MIFKGLYDLIKYCLEQLEVTKTMIWPHARALNTAIFVVNHFQILPFFLTIDLII